MFAPADSWTLPAHLYLYSGWSASCGNPLKPMTCTSDLTQSGTLSKLRRGVSRPVYGWTDITYLLNKSNVSWAAYVDDVICTDPPCSGKTGPPLDDLGAGFAAAKAAGKTKATDLAGFVKESIADPNAYIAKGYAPNVMPNNFADNLSPKQFDALIAFLTKGVSG